MKTGTGLNQSKEKPPRRAVYLVAIHQSDTMLPDSVSFSFIE